MLFHYAEEKVYIVHSFTHKEKGIGVGQFINDMAVLAEYERIKHSLTEYFTMKYSNFDRFSNAKREYRCLLY